MEEKIMTLHPDQGKKGRNISKVIYEKISSQIVAVLKEKQALTFTELLQEVNQKWKGSFPGSLSWYVITVQLDLEARNIILRIPNTRPQMLKLKD